MLKIINTNSRNNKMYFFESSFLISQDFHIILFSITFSLSIYIKIVNVLVKSFVSQQTIIQGGRVKGIYVLTSSKGVLYKAVEYTGRLNL